jgi:hypothetical protein
MSYQLFLGGLLMDIKDPGRLAQSKQVNNITNIGTRQSNATNNFLLPKTANNVRNLNMLGVVGNTSNKPYEKISANLLDTISGDWLVYDGWGIINETADNFKVTVIDGIIDFYKIIDNKKLFEINVSGLNHIKNLTSVVDSWQNNLPYLYIIADYNGKLFDSNELNIDYQVPSARISYIWDKIHEFSGYTYSGSVFLTEMFTNWLMTYPKPITSQDISTIQITTQNAIVELNVTPDGTFQRVTFLPSPVPANIYLEKNNFNQLVVLTSGTYRVSASGIATVGTNEFPNVIYSVVDSANQLLEQGSIDGSGNGFVFLNLSVGQRLILQSEAIGFVNLLLTTLQQVSVDYVEGYVANFEEALIDFTATELHKEVMTKFALIPIKDKYSNHIDYLTLTEVMQNESVLDWSDKNPKKLSEKYIVGSYAQLNKLVYKYNQDDATHNDGSIVINNKNLKEVTTIIASKFYSPNAETTTIFGEETYVFPIWNKEIQDNGDLQYKELSGRYYTHRAEFKVKTFKIKSEFLNVDQNISQFVPYSSYWRLRWRDILLDNYENIKSILNKSKIVETELYLNSTDIASFDFKRLIYISQFSSYYLVNKISNYIKNKPTKVELIEVDFYVDGEQTQIAPYTYIEILNVNVNGCEIQLEIQTDSIFTVELYIEVNQNFVPIVGATINTTDVFIVNATSTVVTFLYTGSVIDGATVNVKAWLGANNITTGIPSNSFEINLSGCNNVAPGTRLDYVSNEVVEFYIELLGTTKKLLVTMNTDVPYPLTVRFWYAGVFNDTYYIDVFTSSDTFEVIVPASSLFGPIIYNSWLQIQNLISNQIPVS